MLLAGTYYLFAATFGAHVLFRQNKIPVVWEDAFYDYALLENTVVGAWRSKEVLAEIVQAGHPGILLYGYNAVG